MVVVRYANDPRKILTFVCHGWCSTYCPIECVKCTDPHTLPQLENEHQRSVKNYWSGILGNISATWSQASINRDMVLCIGRYVRDILATSCWTLTPYFIYRATTKYSWCFYCLKTVKRICTDHNRHIVLWLTIIEGEQLLTLHWHLFSRWGRERCTVSLAYQGSQDSIYDYLQTVAPQITQDTRLTIVNIPLTLIFMMAQGGYYNLFCMWRQPKFTLWLSATYQQCDYPECMNKNHWHSVDAHFQVGAGMVVWSVLPI
jgi:hypothetical protein